MRPYITPFAFEGEANTGDTVQLACLISKGDTPLTITWTLKDRPISPHIGIVMIPIGDRTNLLTISSVSADHAGKYTCAAKNKAGFAEHSAELLVNGKNHQIVHTLRTYAPGL